MMTAFSHDPHWRLLWSPLNSPLPLPAIITSTAARLPRNLTTGRETKRHQKAVDVSTGQIVGYARWLLPESEKREKGFEWPEAQVAEPSVEEKEEFEKKYKNEVDERGRLKGLNYDVMDKLSPRLEEAEEEILNVGVYLSMPFSLTSFSSLPLSFYFLCPSQLTCRAKIDEGETALDYIATDPSRQRSGIGSLLLESGIKEAEKAGVACYVMSTEAGLRLYQKYGFKIVKRVVQSVEEWGGNVPHVHYFLVREVGGRDSGEGCLTPPKEEALKVVDL